ncbi:hypothetical protein KAJ38_02870 [Candidatus Pacearchaeota archaeon]|nr:hypothetical protein [Candidatus Pacearchaeota archaeon]
MAKKKSKYNNESLSIAGIKTSIFAIAISLLATVVSMSENLPLWTTNISKIILIILAFSLLYVAYKIKTPPIYN